MSFMTDKKSGEWRCHLIKERFVRKTEAKERWWRKEEPDN
jgi:hypothetical protein